MGALFHKTDDLEAMPIDDGIYYPVITPFDEEGNVDHETFASLLDFGINRGLHGVFALGSAGQGPTLDRGERKRTLETAAETIDGRVPLVAQVGTSSTTTSVDLARHAERHGVDMISALPPYYYSDHSSREVQDHFAAVADAVDIPLMIYNNPKYTDFPIDPEWLSSLIEEIPDIRGIKASFNPLSDLFEYVSNTPEGFKVFAGGIWSLASGVPMGVAGSIHPPTSVFPELTVEFWNHIQHNDYEQALSLQRQILEYSHAIQPFRNEYGRTLYVTLFGLRGIEIEHYPRWQTATPDEDVRQDVAQALKSVGLGEYIEEAR